MRYYILAGIIMMLTGCGMLAIPLPGEEIIIDAGPHYKDGTRCGCSNETIPFECYDTNITYCGLSCTDPLLNGREVDATCGPDTDCCARPEDRFCVYDDFANRFLFNGLCIR